jgi:hypothetical protein
VRGGEGHTIIAAGVGRQAALRNGRLLRFLATIPTNVRSGFCEDGVW